MHELSLCQNLIEQLTDLANRNGAVAVARVEVRVGMLSGIEPQLLESAYTMARPGTVAETAELVMAVTPPRVACGVCGTEADVPPNDLRCPACDSLATELIAGHELLLARVELIRGEPTVSSV